MTAPMVDYKIHWLKMMSVPESQAVVGRHDGINGVDTLLLSLADRRQAGKVKHGLTGLLRQRVFAIALGDEDVNDHEVLRDDLVLQTACGGDRRLASPSTVGRLERAADRSWAWAAHETLVESFIASYDEAPEEFVLDFDCTDDAVHGRQEGRFFHGYYDHYCFLPLYVFCGDQLLVSYLRPSNIDQAKHAWAILALLVKRLRQAWPAVRLTVRADSGFCRHKMLSWCERHEVGYIVGLAKNARINDQAARGMALAAAAYERTGEKQRVFADLCYGARSWSTRRRVIARLEHGPKETNPGSVRRFVLGPFCQTLTNLSPKMTANCVLASNHSRGGRFHASAA